MNSFKKDLMEAIALVSNIENKLKISSLNGNEKIIFYSILIKERSDERGVFGVPSYYFDNELYWGREHLPMIEAKITNDYSKIL